MLTVQKCSLNEVMKLKDLNGYEINLTKEFDFKVLTVGWSFFLLAIVTNIIYYIVHPMAPQPNPKDKLKTYIFGYFKEFSCKKAVEDDERIQMLPV